jgi:hypothetical protein
MKRLLKIATVLSTVLFIVFLALLPISYALKLPEPTRDGTDPKDSIRLVSDFRCAIYRGGLWFFNGDMAYSGSIIGLYDKSTSFDFPGIYFRQFGIKDAADTWTTLMFSLLYPMVLFAVLPSYSGLQKLFARTATENPELSTKSGV